MIIIHAGFLDYQLWLWGEAPAETSPEAPARRGRKTSAKSKPKNQNRLPFDAGDERLLAALNEVVSGLKMNKSDVETATVWLPTADGQPVASSSLIAEPPSSKSKAEIAPWAVAAIPLSTAEAVDLLCRCVDRETLAQGVIVGHDLAFWASAMRLSGAMVAREQFLPAIEAIEDFYRARWEPVFAGADAQRAQRLAKTMPQVCRALTSSDAGAPPDAPALSALESFIGEVVDYLVRSASTPKKVSSIESAHDQWLGALRSLDGVIDSSSSEMAKLADQTREWRRPIMVSADAPFRLCFRLEEPDKSPDWRVRYLLQASDDPSLLVPVADAWKAKGRVATALKRGKFDPREYLLSTLGQAAGLSPHIERSLKTAAPGGYDLDAIGAHDFLTEKAWMLEQAGYGVMLPAWWTRKGTKLRLSMRANVKSPKLQGSSGLSLDQIVQFDWQVALGGELLSLEELQALAKLKSPLVQVRGQWVELNADEIQAALDFWKKKASDKATMRDVVQMALGRAKTPGGLAFDGVTADGWIGEFLGKLEGRSAFEELPVPEEFHGELRPYQTRGYSWLGFLKQWGLGACLADDMGLGKTVQALALIEREWHANGKRPTLLVCPTSVIGNWQKEAARFTPDLPVMIHHGIARAKGAAFKKDAEKHAIVVSSYPLLQRDYGAFENVNWSGVILDEAQNIKNPETKQARAARALKSDYRVALTGTPVENNVGDLWAIMEFLNPGFLGTQGEFKKTFFIPIQAQRDADASARLKRLTGPFILRRLKTDKTIIADLPEKNEMKVFCTLTKEQASLYAAVAEDAVKTIKDSEGIQRKGVVLATLSKLKQVCNHPAQFLGDNSAIPGRSGKLARLTEMLEEALAAGDRALVFSQFAEMGGIIQKHLQETFGHEVLFLHGATPKKQRDRMVERFQSSNGDGNGPRVFVLSLKAGGTGLNLTAANHVFHFDRWWNPAVENQATDRAFRIGQKRNVQVHKFICAGTLEDKIDEMIESKQAIAASIVGAGENWLTELSTDQLRDLFTLRQDAVSE
ncbi:MAG: RNA polymerase-associated protein RapA [Acidobacteria bacterium]|nr:RNA polymerase-associated protein RapA [Acidobacteriota bacterium]